MMRVLLVFTVLMGCACDPPRRAGPAPTPPTTPTQPPPPQPVEPGGPPDAGAPPLEYADEEFVEADVMNRDPFRGYADEFVVHAPEVVQRNVLLEQTSVDEMRLVAVVGGVATPRAMLLDREGRGHVVKQGDFIGRAEVIQSGGPDSTPIMLNWRVERIRIGMRLRGGGFQPSEIVLSRADTTDETRPPLTRVMSLGEER